MSIQYTLPLRLRSASPGLKPSTWAWANPGLCALAFAVQAERDDRRFIRAGHLQSILDAARLEFGQRLFQRRPGCRPRQIDPDAGPYFAVGDALARVVAAAPQSRGSMGRLGHVAERPHADASLHGGDEPGGRIGVRRVGPAVAARPATRCRDARARGARRSAAGIRRRGADARGSFGRQLQCLRGVRPAPAPSAVLAMPRDHRK